MYCNVLRVTGSPETELNIPHRSTAFSMAEISIPVPIENTARVFEERTSILRRWILLTEQATHLVQEYMNKQVSCRQPESCFYTIDKLDYQHRW